MWGMYRAKQALAAAGMAVSDTGAAGAAAGGACAKAKACCEAVYSQPPYSGQGAQACASLPADGTPFSDTACGAALQGFVQAGAAIAGGAPAACN